MADSSNPGNAEGDVVVTAENRPKVFGDRDVPVLEGWMGIPGVAERLKVSRSHAFKLAQRGTFRSEHRIGDFLVVSTDEVEELATRREDSES